MLIKSEMNAAEKPIIIKYVDGVDRSGKAAFRLIKTSFSR